ncbi:uncharacterized protein LOC117110010 isoform X2 [Anneissia japonica]|uniref:uncharacterized protein LOC117110010 isoform X2 n=1 Tax=Anneissia japonica TaxID=1529436 RepID=UPI00142584F0|nr:uncharacterized protein LOC117110010 isoform X2 [Anneissia japonica]
MPSEAARSMTSYACKLLEGGIHKKLVAKLTKTTVRPTNIFQQMRSFLTARKDIDKSFIPNDVTCIWDYAGQLTYYISHRFFLTGGSSYCVVFSVLDDLDTLANPRNSLKGQLEMTNLQMNVFWMRSIYEHAVLPYHGRTEKLINGISSPTISLVATHKDKLLGTESEKNKLITTKFKRIFDEVEGTPYRNHVDREMYVVDNTVRMDEGIEKLKKNVAKYMKATAKPIPTSWVDFQSKVQDVGKTRLHVSLDEIAEIASECGISEPTLNTVLDYLNDTGIILYSKTNEKLKYTVITNLCMMIDVVTKIITVVKPDDIEKLPILKQWEKLDREGILQEQLLHHLWRHEIAKDASNLEVFLEIMKMFGLLFEQEKGSQPGNRIFIVPTRMQINKEGLKVRGDEQQTASFYVTPTDFLPDAVYNVLVVSFLDLMNDKGRNGDHVELFRNRSDFYLDDEHVVSLGAVRIKNRHALKIEISRRMKVYEHGKEELLEPHPSICMEVLSYIRQQLKTVYVTTEGVGYELHVLCNACDATLQPLHKLEECLMKESVPCGKTKSVVTTRFKRLFSTAKMGHAASSPEHVVIQGMTDAQFSALKMDVAVWYDNQKCLTMLKVLFRDHVVNERLSKIDKTVDLLNDLVKHGHLNSKNLTILHDTISTTEHFGLQHKIKVLLPSFADVKEGNISKQFSHHRQKLMKFGMNLTPDNVTKIDGLLNMPCKEYTDGWSMITDLEDRQIISEKNMKEFTDSLRSLEIHPALNALQDEL